MLVQCVGILVPALGVNFGSHDLILRAACNRAPLTRRKGTECSERTRRMTRKRGPKAPPHDYLVMTDQRLPATVTPRP